MFHSWLSTALGEVLVATETDKLCYIHMTGGVRTEGMVMEGVMRNRILSISYSPDGKICAGTNGNGLFYFTGDTLSQLSPRLTGCSQITATALSLPLTAAYGQAMRKASQSSTLLPDPSESFSSEFGVTGDCMPMPWQRHHDGSVYVGTTEGVSGLTTRRWNRRYLAPPQAGILSVVISNVEYPYRESYNLPYRSSYTVTVNYAGISLRDPLNVVFRTKLENFDEEWGEPTSDRSVTYRLSDGHYRFMVEALDP